MLFNFIRDMSFWIYIAIGVGFAKDQWTWMKVLLVTLFWPFILLYTRLRKYKEMYDEYAMRKWLE